MGMMINRRRVYGGKKLPYDAEIEYLRGTGTQYIDTGYTPVIGDSIYCEFMLDVAASTIYHQALYSAGTGNYQVIFLIAQTPNGISGVYIKHFASGAAAILNYYTSVNTWYTLTVTSAGVSTIGNHTITSNPKAEIDGNEKTLWLWKRRNNTSPFNGRIRRFYIKNNGVMKLDLIPVRKGTTGYMYDKVSGKLFGNAGTGEFILGLDLLPSGYTQVEYIENTRDAYIDTGVKPSLSLAFEFNIACTKYIPAGDMTEHSVMGSRNQNSGNSGIAIWITTSSLWSYSYGNRLGDVSGISQSLSTNVFYTFEQDKNSIKRDGNVLGVFNSRNLTETSYNITIFNLNDGSAGMDNRIAKIKAKYWVIKDGDTIIRNYIPCINPNNVVGMYDTVEGKFYSSPNGAAFVAGPVV